jgi:alanine-glyoxylate transaminase/serine-glyoxylate transaminase/serine-pyruvate transaminase
MTSPDALDLSNYPDLNTPVRTLLGPGPSMIDPRVLRAMAQPVIGHLDPAFIALMDKVQELLRYVFQTENELTIPVSGTGSAGMEASVANMVEPGDAVLICINGYFGTRLAEMARRYGGEVETIERPLGEVFSPDEIKAALDARPAKVVAIVHGETSSGAEQPMEGIADIVHAQGGVLIVDTVASLSGVPFNVDELGVDVCYTGTQKCLSCPPGLAPITLSPRAREVLQKRQTPVANWYLDLSMVEKYWGPERTYHHTAPISSNYALYEGLRIVAEEGLTNRWQRHRQNAELLWEGLEAIDLTMHVPPQHRLVSLTTVRVPDGIDPTKLRKQLLDEYNIEIAGGFGELKGKVWRVGLMGYSSRKENVTLLLGALERLLH